jgi:hypothetical protein
MNGVLSAELAVLLKLDSFLVVLLVLHIVIVALFALGASERDSGSGSVCHDSSLLKDYLKIHPFAGVL